MKPKQRQVAALQRQICVGLFMARVTFQIEVLWMERMKRKETNLENRELE